MLRPIDPSPQSADAPSTDAPAPGPKAPGPAPLVADSTIARVLYSAWSGEQVTILDSPPGGGKSHLVVEVAAHLVTRSDLRVTIATPTRAQAVGLAARLAEMVEPDRVYLSLSRLTAAEPVPSGVRTPGGKTPAPPPGVNTLTISTIASAEWSQPDCDVMLVDEAYQATYAAVAAAANNAEQVVLVGDPGQIGPVITCDTSIWSRRRVAPHHRAPEAFVTFDGATRFRLGSTRRLGPATTAALAPLYDFAFDSIRGPRSLVGGPEIAVVEVPETGDPFDMAMLSATADAATALVGATVRPGDGDDITLAPTDIAVVLSQNAQVSAVQACLAGDPLAKGITVGTADRLQGGEWECVVAVDPLTGFSQGGNAPHSLALGRLCVMASRHRTQLTWVHDGGWDRAIEEATYTTREAKVAGQVRRHLGAVARRSPVAP